ncbi:flagellar basal body-associated FliL family protein [Sphingomonas sp. AX6]|uniref:flagellar basal body-associated FliL family protein n=1 Tax=Sphingomonas sp. AX6 TaxID=2653171 RepID=UPI0012F25B76|nr:flagellar basal body-associated FliL family protein [Sphingomonas sp. AX6]VXC70270.1 Flagellar protein FliL [Sphingomonas sp. AX6]
MSDEKAEAAPKKKGKFGKLLMVGGALLLLIGGGVGAGVYVGTSGMLGGGAAHAAEAKPEPQLVPKDQQERATVDGAAGGTTPTPKGEGGSQYASTYYVMEKEFTSNLLDSVHFVQMGIAISTPYDKTVIENLKTHELAVRSAVLMQIGETPEEQVFSSAGKQQLQRRIAKAMNDTLQEKEGFGGIGNVYFTTFVVQ